MKMWPLRIFLGVVVVLMLGVSAASWWTGNTQPFRATTAGYSFSITADGRIEEADGSGSLKGVEFDADDAERLKSDGSASWEVTVTADVDPGVEMDYIAYFEPFYRDGIFDTADVVVYRLGVDQECTHDDSATQARDFFERIAIPADETFTRTYCIAAIAPDDEERRSMFDQADATEAPEAFFNLRHSAL